MPATSRSVATGEDARARLQLLAEAIGGYVYEWDVASGEVWQPAALLTLLGFGPDEIVADADFWRTRLHPDDLAARTKLRVASFGDPTIDVMRSEFRVAARDGSWRWLAEHARLVRDETGRVVRVLGVTTDVTVARERAEALEQAQQSARAARDRTAVLQHLSAELTRMLTREEIADVVIRHLESELGAYTVTMLELDHHTREDLGTLLPADATTRAWVSLPLTVEDRHFGAITVVLREWGQFSDDDERFMRAVADLCAQSLDRAQLFALEREARVASERAAKRIGALQAVTAALNGARTAAAVGDAITRIGLYSLGATRGSLALLDAAGDTLEVVATAGYPDELLARFPSIPLRSPYPFCDAVRNGAAVLLRSGAERAARYPALVGLPGTNPEGALAAVPLSSDGRVIGVLGASWDAGRDFDEDDRAFLHSLAHQAAQAMDRTRYLEAEQAARLESEQRLRAELAAHATAAAQQARAEFVAEASRLLASSLDYHATLESLARAAVPRLGDWCAVDMLSDPASSAWPPQVQRLAVMHQDPDKIAWAQALHDSQPPDWSAPTGLPRVLRDGVAEFYPVITDEQLVAWAKSAEELALLREVDLRAFLCVPLIARGRTLGALTLCLSESGRHYLDADLALAEDLAQRAATAVDNARLFAEVERARAEAEAANLAKVQFLTTMSHELRTPLNAIGGYAEMLEIGVRGPVSELQVKDLRRIQKSQRHLLSLINEVLNYARVESGNVHYDLQVAPVADSLHAIAPLVLPQARAKALELDVEQCAREMMVRADMEKLQQILLNLLSNAIKFTDRGGRITVTCMHVDARGDTPRVAISVEDTGIGIDPSQIVRVFEPFVQVGRSLNSPGEGAGLGLSISRDLARAMGGELTATSTPGAGSNFVLTLPAR